MALDPAHGRHLLQQMIRLRRLEEKAAELYSAGKIRGFLHLYIGEEAVAVGICEHLASDDAVVSTYREHGHALMRGISAGAIMAEMYGKQEGCSRGRGGSMHLFSAAERFYGGNAIVAGGIPLAIGLALADRMQGRARVTACFFGDGAVAEGEFHESLNLAALWRLPVLFVCENNLYAMGTALPLTHSETELSRKAAAYRVPSVSVDGMDVLAVETAAAEGIAHVRAGEGPFFLEARTYRFRGHSMFDAQLYREKAEIERWLKRDPIELLGNHLREVGALDDAGSAAIEAEVAAEMTEAIAFAEAGTLEPVEDLLRFVHSEAPR
jgi:pyruvate dehydrogenase E1 component alpha subunit